MFFPRTYIAIIAILSAILIFSYPMILADKTEALWGPIQGRFRMVYYVSIALVLLGFIPFSIELVRRDDYTPSQSFALLAGLLTLIFSSWLWIFLSKAFATNSPTLTSLAKNILRALIILILLIVSLSILLLATQAHTANLWVYVGLAYGIFHTFFLDYILWVYMVLF